jgi:thiol-disulfide isomerase/thioredoxin
MIKPLFEELSSNFKGVAFGLIDIDQNHDAAEHFVISSVPTFLFFDGESMTERFSGADSNKLETFVKELDAMKAEK